MQVGNFCLHARKFRLAGLFVNRKTVHKIAVRCETSRFFSAESYKVTLEKSRDTSATGG